MDDFKKLIRDVPDFPKKGIVFKDITPLIGNPIAFKEIIDHLAQRLHSKKIDKIVSVEARGFIFGSALAYSLGAGIVPVRKPGKLPYETISADYELEYGTDSLLMHKDAIKKGETVVIVDDLLATGGTINAVLHLVESLGGIIHEIDFVVELQFLGGRQKLTGRQVYSLITF